MENGRTEEQRLSTFRRFLYFTGYISREDKIVSMVSNEMSSQKAGIIAEGLLKTIGNRVLLINVTFSQDNCPLTYEASLLVEEDRIYEILKNQMN